MSNHQHHSSIKHPNQISKRTRHTDQARLKILINNLQLRLNYAKLKVSHGWHTHTFNQVESLYYSTQLHHHHHHHQSSTSSTSSTSSPPTLNSNPSSNLNQLPQSISKSNPNPIQSTPKPTLLDLALTRSKSDSSTPQHSRSSSQPSSPSNPTDSFNHFQFKLNQDLHSFLLPHHQVSPNQSFFSNSNQIFGTPAAKSSHGSLETPNRFQSISSSNRRMSKSFLSLFPNLFNHEPHPQAATAPASQQSSSENWNWTNSNFFSPITFNKNSSIEHLKENELIESQTPMMTHKFHSINKHHELNLNSISPLRFSLNSTKKSSLKRLSLKTTATAATTTTTGNSSNSSSSCSLRSHSIENLNQFELEESQDRISLDDLDSINWTSN
ncbi:hypothetical protein DFH28DRAFT_889736 [Melampsora americana]|nr:hypothetical protein DFH28DRAFT_889736 [Melampsora americana]